MALLALAIRCLECVPAGGFSHTTLVVAGNNRLDKLYIIKVQKFSNSNSYHVKNDPLPVGGDII